MRTVDAGRRARGKGRGTSILLARYDQSTIHPTGHPLRALGHKVPQRTDLERLLGLIIAGERKGVAPPKAEHSRRWRECSQRFRGARHLTTPSREGVVRCLAGAERTLEE
jgi:hypothetical protein